jgi:hypothetical protein
MFYAALVLLTDAWLEQVRALIADQLGEPRPSREEIAARLGSQRKLEPEPVPVAFVPGGLRPGW